MTDAGIIGAARTPIGGEAERTLTRIYPSTSTRTSSGR